MTRLLIVGLVVLVSGLSAPRGAVSARQLVSLGTADTELVSVIRAYVNGLAGVRASNPDVHLSVGRDPAVREGPVLLVEYPAPTADPAARDVQCDVENQDWTAGRAIAFHVKPAHPMTFSLSFIDRNHVAYTTWVELTGGEWQLVRIPFDKIRPNPYFQPPDARTGMPLDVSDVKRIAFAPQDQTSGRLAIGPLVVAK